MEVLRKHTNGTHTRLYDVIELQREYYNTNVWDYYSLIKTKKRENGKFMIKKQSLKFIHMSWDYKAYRKTYFCYADAGIAFTLNRKDDGIFYCDKYLIIVRLAKYLSANASSTELVSIVNRHNGKEHYILNKTQTRWERTKIFVK